jgi:SAM-dependent MidA family methyltransferase
MTLRDLVQRKIAEDIYGRMTDEERLQMELYLRQEYGHREIMEELRQQRAQMSQMARKMEKQSWVTDFGSDVAANFLTDGLIWLVRRLSRRT